MPVKNGDTDTITPALEAVVCSNAIFSIRKYIVIPQNPAAANINSCLIFFTDILRGDNIKSTVNPIIKRKNNISTGAKLFSNILVEVKVVPHTNIAVSAKRCPDISFFVLIFSPVQYFL